MNFSRQLKKKKQPDERQLLSYATWLLAQRDYSRMGLLKKFQGHFLEDAELFEKVLKRLIRLGLQSDECFVENFVSVKVGWGPVRIRLELQKKGITLGLIEKTLTIGFDEAKRCREVLHQKLGSKSLPPEWKEKQKLLAFLIRRGFNLKIARDLLGD